MDKTIDIKIDIFERLYHNRLFFLRLYENYHYDEKGNEYDYSQWQSIDRELDISIDADNFADRSLGYCLCVVDRSEHIVETKGDVGKGNVIMHFHDLDSYSVHDWVSLFENYGTRAVNQEDKYAFMSLLWVLDKKSVNCSTIESAIRRFDSQYHAFFIDAIMKVSRCLSRPKQEQIVTLCSKFGCNYQIYMPPIVTELYQSVCNTFKNIDRNLFKLIDDIFKSSYKPNIETLAKQNPLAAVFRWFYNEEPLNNYDILRSVFAMLSEEKRLNVVKRYFHDIRLKNTEFDPKVITQFIDNDFDVFIRYRYCTETPGEPILLTVPLLCDNVLTLYNTKGNKFQDFDGVLDFAMTHCDMAQPSIQFKMERFIPTCDGGAVYNSNFKGFIDYQTVHIIDNDLLSDENLLNNIRYILDSYGEKLLTCSHEENKIINGSKEYRSCKKFECLITHNDKWLFPGNFAAVLNSFIKKPGMVSDTDVIVTSDMLSVETFKNYILKLPTQFIQISEEEFLVPSFSRRGRTYDHLLLERFSKIKRLRIFPQDGAIVGKSIDVFGFWRKVVNEHFPTSIRMSENEMKRATEEFCNLERPEVRKRTIDSLKEELQTEFIQDSYFEIPFDRDILSKVVHKFYFKSSISENDPIYVKEFLTNAPLGGKFKPFCAPELSKKHNPAIDLPYFWCRGKECFRNNLHHQTIEKQKDWHEYSLYHLIEIIGYPKIHETEGGYEPDPVVWKFIAVTNKVAQKFKRLKCRTCGHMLFSSYRVTGFNRFNYYGCLNPSCVEHGKLVYLNYCFHCKKGLIDSRDTKQCPNGWYICPTCLSCCDDSQYERQAQRYILSGKPVPERIESKRGKGHNDKGEYFCPQCGNPIELIQDENGTYYKGCRTCKRNFDLEEEQEISTYN